MFVRNIQSLKTPSFGLKLNCNRQLFIRSEEEKRQKRKQLWSEIEKGYFSDFHEFRHNNGKRFEAPTHLLSKKEAIKFPLISGQSLLGDTISLPTATRGKVGLVLLSMRAIGMKMCDEYRIPFEELFSQNHMIVVYQLNIVDQMFFRMIKTLLHRNLKRLVEPTRQSHFICHSGKFSDSRRTLNIHNSIIGYAYLLDTEGSVRWNGHSHPTKTEINSLIKCTKDLIKKQ